MKKILLLSTAFLASTLMSNPVEASSADGFTKKQVEELKGHIKTFLLENPETVEASLIALQEKKNEEKQALAQVGITKNKDALFQNDKDPYLGSATGTQQIVAFLDPFCGHCRKFKDILRQAVDKNPDVKVILKDFPILGDVAILGAKAMLAAHQQGLYLQMQDKIYKAAPTLTKKEVLSLAGTIPGLDLTRFEKDLDAEEVKKHLADIYSLATSIGVNATPTLIIGGKMIEGGLPLDALEKVLKDSAA